MTEDCSDNEVPIGPVIGKMDEWWSSHPFFKKFYVPLVLTATMVITFIDAVNGGGCGC